MAEANVLDHSPVRVAIPAVQPRRQRGPARWVILGALIILLIFTLFPFFLALINAIKPGTDYIRGGPLSIPTAIQFDSIAKFWTTADYSRKLFNSALISGSVSVLRCSSASLTPMRSASAG